MPFTYQDYLNAVNPQRRQDAYEGLFSEDQWNALSPAQQVANAGMLSINPGDPRYAALAQQTGAEPGRSITFAPGQASTRQGLFNDPSRVFNQDGYNYYAANNVSAQEQARSDSSGLGDGTRWGIVGPAFVLGGGLAYNALAGGAAGASGAGAEIMGPPASSMNLGLETLAPVQGSTVGGMASTPSFGSTGILGNLMNGNFGAAASGVGQWAMNNPLQAAGLVQSVGGLFSGGGSSGASTGGSSGSKQGGGTGLPKIDRPSFIQNPYLAAQLRAGGYQ